MKNLMKQMLSERTTNYFRDYAVAQIKIAHRIKEYLIPDDNFKPQQHINEGVQKALEIGDEDALTKAIEAIFQELNINIGCSSGYESLVQEAKEFTLEIRKKFFFKRQAQLEKEREELLKKLAKVDAELGKEDPTQRIYNFRESFSNKDENSKENWEEVTNMITDLAGIFDKMFGGR